MNSPEENRARVERLRERDKKLAEWIHQCLQQGLNPYDGSADPEFKQRLVDFYQEIERENRKRDRIPHTAPARGSFIHILSRTGGRARKERRG